MNNLTLIFSDDKVLVKKDETLLPTLDEVSLSGIKVMGEFHHPTFGRSYWGKADEGFQTPEEMEFINRRNLWHRGGEQYFHLGAMAYAIVDWEDQSHYCGRCGKYMEDVPGERARRCSCGHILYPIMSPAIIVAVERDGKILLAHHAKSKNGMYSLLAGFLEAGESLEEAIHRELREEVGIEVGDIEYFGSQAWPFPRSLMVGFTAKWKDGELHPDAQEVVDAKWFAPNDMPMIPEGVSISRKLIDNFLKNMA